MRTIFEFFLYVFARMLLALRYRIKIQGLKELRKKRFSNPGGVIFLANHPAEIDPIILIGALWLDFKPHPIAIDYLFRMPILGPLLRFIGALQVPNFDASSNSYKRKEMEKTYTKLFSYIDKGENLLLYPAGSLKDGPAEIIGGASGVKTILERRPDINIVFVRTLGLWGSSFSRAPTGKTPELVKAFFDSCKILCRNFIFFAPRRTVEMELIEAPADFPRTGSRREINGYLENWYNVHGPEPLKLVSFSRFSTVYPKIKGNSPEERLFLESVSVETKQKVMEEIAKLTRVPLSEITDESHLAQDLGLDSLDTAQLTVALKENFGINFLKSTDLTTVGSVLAYASKIKKSGLEEEENTTRFKVWEKDEQRPPALYPDGKTIPEVFLQTCDRLGKHIACADLVAQELNYQRLKIVVLLLAEGIAKLPGEKIGIMLPASVAVNAIILATIFAGKIPVMINWTLGERNLNSVAEQSGIEVTLSSRQFIDRLDGVELGKIDDQIVLMENMRASFSLFDKLKAALKARKKTKPLLKSLGLNTLSTHAPAVILFTSGTESFPKAVPLSHDNILSDQKGAYSLGQLESSDVMLGALPPFHSFGFAVTGLLPLLAGLRVAYSPNPTDGKRIAEAVERWKVTLLCLAPTFLKNLLRVSTEKNLKSLRMVVTGAEKTAPELITKLRELNGEALLVEGYGITECAPILTLNPPGAPPQGVGIPLPEVELRIVNPETYEPVPIGQQGLILARGPNIFSGYLDPKLASPFLEMGGKKWYNTGDLGFLDSRNYLTLSGRLKRFVKIGGEMVSLTSIEDILHQKGPQKGWQLDPDLPSFAVCPLEIDGKKSEMHLFTTFETTVDEVNQILRESGMSNIIKIRSVKKLPFIPLLASGKIDYRKLATKLQ